MLTRLRVPLECWSPTHRRSCLHSLPYFPSKVLVPSIPAIARQTPSLAFAPPSSQCQVRASMFSPLQHARKSSRSFMMLSGGNTLTTSFPTPTPVSRSKLPWRMCKRASISPVLRSMTLQFQGGPAGISLRRERAVFDASKPRTAMRFSG